MRVLLFGASGMVGIEVLHSCFEETAISKVDAVVRRSLEIDHPKLTEHHLTDFSDMSSIQSLIEGCDICIYCVGVYQGKVPEEMFWKITVEYLQELLNQINQTGSDPVFCLFSAAGADPSEASWRPLFARAKGRAETLLFESNLSRRFAVRPGYIKPGRKSANGRIPDWLVIPVYKLVPFIGIDATDLADAMLHICLNGHDITTLENSDLRKLSRSIA